MDTQPNVGHGAQGHELLREVLGKLRNVTGRNDRFKACCPGHDDQNPSLSIRLIEGKVVFKCFTGCDQNAIWKSLGYGSNPNWSSQTRTARTQKSKAELSREVASYSYEDEHGSELFKVVRFEPKTFRPFRKLAEGGYAHGLTGTRRVLFRLPQIIIGVQEGKTIYLCEGEKDVLAMERRGCIATTNFGGALNWEDSYTSYFIGAKVVVLVDRDDKGAQRAVSLRDKLEQITESLTFMQAKHGKDAHDHLDAGFTADEFEPYLFPELGAGPVEDVKIDRTYAEDFVTLAELYEMDLPKIDWLIEGLIPRGGMVGIFAKPKVGKSAFVRTLVHSLMTRADFLGRKVKPAKILWFALEDRMECLRVQMKQLGIEPSDELIIAFARKNYSDPEELSSLIEFYKPDLVIVDTLIRFKKVNKIEDYAEMTEILTVFAEICKATQTTLLFCHHSKKAVGEDVGDSALGSTAILGMVDTAIYLSKKPTGERIFETIQRYGEVFEQTMLKMDDDTGEVYLGQEVRVARVENLMSKILDCLLTGPKTTQDLRNLTGSTQVSAMLKKMADGGQIERSGKGAKGSPNVYSLKQQVSF